MSIFYHMSRKRYAVGCVIKGNGLPKVDPRIEDAFEKLRPSKYLNRFDAVYCRAYPDFFKCGILEGYIYRVVSQGESETHDLSWLKDPEKALFKAKHIDAIPTLSELDKYPDWTDELLKKCSTGYWSAAMTETPIVEHLVREVKVVEVLSDTLVAVKDTIGGWQPPATKGDFE